MYSFCLDIFASQMTRVFTIEGNQMLVRVRKGDQTGVKKEFSLRYAKLKGRILY